MGAAQKRLTPTVQRVEASLLIWLDSSVNTLQESIDAQHQLRFVTGNLVVFEREDDCENYIGSLKENDRAILIVSGKLGQAFVPKVEKNGRLVSIYVYCGDMSRNQWTRDHPKVQGLAVQLQDLILKIKSGQSESQNAETDNTLLISTFTQNDTQEKTTSQMNGDFVQSQLLIYCLLKMKSPSKPSTELISVCGKEYKDNPEQSIILKEFRNEYSRERAIEWYTRESFIYKMLNQALRTQNFHVLYLFRFLIRDLEENLSRLRGSSVITVYRGQFMWENELDDLKQCKDQLISINSFLSTSCERKRAIAFLENKTGLERILFEITADPNLKGAKPFAYIGNASRYKREEEVLFMIGSIFRIDSVSHDRNGVWTIRLTLCGDQNPAIRETIDHYKSQDDQVDLDLIRLGNVLQRMGRYDDAERYYQRCLDETDESHNDHDKSTCYHALGSLERSKGHLQASLDWFHESLRIDKKNLKPNDPIIASTYIDIGNVHNDMGDLERALESYQSALEILRNKYGENNIQVATCYNNIGVVYKRQKNYSNALNMYQKALEIRQNCLPSNHCDIGASYDNIGIICRCCGEYDRALQHYKKALEIYQAVHSVQHPDIAMTLHNIGIVYEDQRDWKNALSYYNKAKTIYSKTFSSTHQAVLDNEKSIQRVSQKLH
ncbi:unnamed protein product [Adineta ricciae]|uniref:ADP ribosyltransferase domain-containing protein n=1 Tax=Adineta ricciae TaxID=249248 RepID=A0A816BTM4_ADIRI|nr:unnamed protein product [Adineta ricciae]